MNTVMRYVLGWLLIMGSSAIADDVLLELGPDGDFVVSANGRTQISFNRDGTIDAANLPVSTFVEVKDPTKVNDASEGFIAGSWWYNETDRRLFVCTDASDDAAVWLAVVRELGIADVEGLDDALTEKAGLSVVYTRSDVDLFLSDKQDLIGDGDLTIENTAGLQSALDALWPRDAVDADDSLGDSDDLVPTQGAVKAYVDSRVVGVNWIESAVAGTTRNVPLTGLDPVDGQLIAAGDRVVVMSQDDASENGVYGAADGAWSRVVEMDADDEYQGRVVFVSGGLTNRNSSWWSSFENGEIEFFQISKVSGFSEGAGISIVNGDVSVSSSVLATIEGNRQKVGLTTRQAGLIELINDKANLADTYTDDEVDALLTLKQDRVMDGDLRIAQTDGLQDALDARILRSAISRDPLLGDSHSTVSSQAAIKAYVDSRAVGLSWSGSVRMATTETVTLADAASVDGLATVVGDRILVRAQDDATENGIYVVADGSWGRAADMDEVAEYGSRAVFVTDGASNGGSSWVSQYDNGAIEFTQFSRTTEYTAGAGLLLQGGQFSVLDEVLNEVATIQDKADAATVYLKQEVDDAVATKQDSIGDGDLRIAQTDGLQAELDAKALAADVYEKTDVDGIAATKQDVIADEDLRIAQTEGLQAALNEKALAADVYVKTEVDDLVAAKQNLIGDGDLAIAKTDGLQDALDAKAVAADTYTKTEVDAIAATKQDVIEDGDLRIAQTDGLQEALDGLWPVGSVDTDDNLGDSDEVVPTQAAVKAYVDSRVVGVSWVESAVAGTTRNLALTGLDATDGVALSEGDRVVVMHQDDGTENGIYEASAGAWTRVEEMNAPDEYEGLVVFIANGVTHRNSSLWSSYENGAISFFQISQVSGFSEGEGISILNGEVSVEQSLLSVIEANRLKVGLTAGQVALINEVSDKADSVSVYSRVESDALLADKQDVLGAGDLSFDHVDGLSEALGARILQSEISRDPLLGNSHTTVSSQAAIKQYVDSRIVGLSWSASARVATTGSVALNGPLVVDAVQVAAGDRVLVRAQDDATDNGIYVVADGDWGRAADQNEVSEYQNRAVFVAEGTTFSGSSWVSDYDQGVIQFSQFASTTSYTAGAGLVLEGSQFSVLPDLLAEIDDISEKADAADVYTKTEVDDLAATKQAVIDDGDLRIAQTDGLQDALDAKALAADVYSKTEVDGIAATKQDLIEDGDLRIAQTDGLEAALGEKAVAASTYTKTEVDDIAATKQDVIADGDLTIAKTDSLQAALDAKAVAADTYTKTEVDDIAATKQDVIADGDLTIAKTDGLQAALDAKAVAADTYTKTEVDDIAATKQDVIADGDLTIAKTDGLQAALDAKVALASIDTDSTMAANSDSHIPSQRAVREFVSQFDRNLANVLSVGEGGEFATIQAALDSITDNAVDKRYLIYVGPGEYPEQLQMKPFVDVQGAGRNMTRIIGTGADSLADAAVIQMASNSVLRDLSVFCTSANAYAVGLHVDTVTAQASAVDVVVSGGTAGNVGILVDDSHCELENVAASASGATGRDYGIWYRTAASAVTGVVRSGSYAGGTCAALLDAPSATLKIYGAVLDGGAHADAGVLFVQGAFDANGCALPQVCGNTYVVIDVSGGPSADTYPVSYLSEVPLDLLDDLRYRTDLIVLRRLSAAQYVQGSPSSEAGRDDNETRRRVRLTKDYYVGVFEVTQGQYLYVMGGNPSTYTGVSRPVENVSWQTVRGPAEDWPAGTGLPDEHSFMGRLSAKTGLTCDLPTEAEWEYACRGGSHASLGSGQSVAVLNGADAAVDAVGRYLYNHGGAQHVQVGSYQPNAFGLYDMHGNVYEWCLDRWDGFADYDSSFVNPEGAADGNNRVRRGGAWSSSGRYLRAANRDAAPVGNQHHGTGFRLVMRP